MSDSLEYNIKSKVDVRGKHCPIPVLTTVKSLAGLSTGEKIEILATDESFCSDINTLTKTKGCKIVLEEKREDYHYFVLEKI